VWGDVYAHFEASYGWASGCAGYRTVSTDMVVSYLAALTAAAWCLVLEAAREVLEAAIKRPAREILKSKAK